MRASPHPLLCALVAGVGACAPAPPAPPPEPASPPPPVRTVETRAETPCQWSGRHGLAWEPVAAANGLGADAQLAAGGALVVPPGTPAPVYTVVRGDTLSWVAGWTGLTVAALAAANGIAHPDVLEVGDVLALPPGATTACPPARRPPRPPPRAAEGLPPATRRDASDLLDRALERYVAADYTASAGAARRAAALLAPHGGGDAGALEARALVLEGLARVGQGEEEPARDCFARALARDPGVRVDAELASPKVRALFESARAPGGAAR